MGQQENIQKVEEKTHSSNVANNLLLNLNPQKSAFWIRESESRNVRFKSESVDLDSVQDSVSFLIVYAEHVLNLKY